MPQATPITDHRQIMRWAEERGGRPARVRDTADRSGEGGVLRFDFDGDDASLEKMSWMSFSRSSTRTAWPCSSRRKPATAA